MLARGTFACQMPEHFHQKARRSKNRAPVLEMSAVGSDPDVPVSELLSELLNRKMLYELLEKRVLVEIIISPFPNYSSSLTSSLISFGNALQVKSGGQKSKSLLQEVTRRAFPVQELRE